MVNNKKFYPTYYNIQKIWGAIGSLQKNINSEQETTVVIPDVPSTGTYVLKAIDGELTWVEEVE